MPSTDIYPASPARGWRPWGVLVPFLGIAFVVIGQLSVQAPLDRYGLMDQNDDPVGYWGLAAFLAIVFGATALLVIAWVLLVERRPLAGVGLGRARALSRFIIGIVAGVGMMGAIVAGIWFCGALAPGAVAPAFASPASLAAIFFLLVCFVIQASTEEFLFRGWILSAIATKFGTAAGVIVSSAVFTLLHFDRGAPPLFYLNIVLFALFAAFWSIRTKSIWGAMGWHSGWNWLLGTGFGLKVTGLDTHLPALVVSLAPAGPVWLTGGEPGSEASIVCTAVLLAGIAVNLALMRRASRLSTS
jgi:membrane protease YdiL (CAAX protease family)